MKKLLRHLFLALVPLLILNLSLFSFVARASALSVKPFPPFSEEGNPEEGYYWGELFNLFRFIRPAYLKINENLERDRKYEDLIMCPGPDVDRRDYVCDNAGDGCDGGEVDFCHNTLTNKSFAETIISKNGNCKYFTDKDPNNPDAYREGKCEYKQRPNIIRTITGTDFSADTTDLVYGKLQSEKGIYNNQGGDNTITWGSQFLGTDQCEISFRQLLVVRRAKQTKATLRETGEWPLGWVDWGYKDEKSGMTKTLLEINDELPSVIGDQMLGIVEGVDDFYLNAGNLDAVSDFSAAKKIVCDAVGAAQGENPQPEWVKDLSTVPMHSPSYRQGYARPSICVWDICCPGGRCKVEPEGNKRSLYYDTSISQTFGAALDDLLLNYPLVEGAKLFKKIAINNPLVRFATSASPNAIPSAITKRMNEELAGTCLQYIPWGNWFGFGTHIDYVNPGDFLGPNNTCPDYQIAPELIKETGGSYPSSFLSVLLDLIWGETIDDLDHKTYHLITIPDAMGQSIDEIQQPMYDTRDSLPELESVKEYNEGNSNNIEDQATKLIASKGSGPARSKRDLAYYTCADPMFSAQTLTGIEAYALGTRIGCFDTSKAPAGKCDGQLFAKLLENSKYKDTSTKGTDYFNSNIKGNLTAELMNTYAAAEKETGVPCEILAGIHFVEADNNPDGSLVSGRKIGDPEPDAGGKVFKSLLETAYYAGDHLKGKVGGNLKDVNTVITALSRYNGGGNSNCQAGYPYPIPYGGCPRAFEGEDDPYPTNYLDNKHNTMYLLYCADYTACAPQVFERPGSFTVALNVYNSMTKDGYKSNELPSPVPRPSGSLASPTASMRPPIFPKSCGPESLSTALGCIPYTVAGFTSSLLTFIVSIAGGIALLVMLIATIQIMTAGDNTEQLKKGRELFTSAIVGLLFLIFSVSLLRLIAGDIIKLPGFGG